MLTISKCLRGVGERLHDVNYQLAYQEAARHA